MTAKALRVNQLPLLGSNQDSPDPESDRRYPHTGNSASGKAGLAPESATGHTKTHTKIHRPVGVLSVYEDRP
jgi:hypothetical protein